MKKKKIIVKKMFQFISSGKSLNGPIIIKYIAINSLLQQNYSNRSPLLVFKTIDFSTSTKQYRSTLRLLRFCPRIWRDLGT
jgi:hypothetical protein